MCKAKETLRTPPSEANDDTKQSCGASAKITVSTGGYVEYKRSSQHEDSTYEDIDDPYETPEGNATEQIYANEFVINKGKLF